jgi:monofunctional biosynthetic peptidoglycan transglycosylase
MSATPKRKPAWRKWLRIIGLSIAAFFGFTILWVVALKWINPPTTYLQLTGDCPKGSVFHKEWVDGNEISSHMKLAVVASEDNNFMKHGGIDWGAVEKARKYNETEGKRKGKYRGASTITQQTAKNVFLWPGQSKVSKWIRKGFEVYFTYLIEWIWGKERIMEVYLNVIEMGPCKYGVGAAAKDYFGVSASNLSREQAALIAACLPNPKKYSVSKPGSYMKKRQTQIARLMRLIGDDYFNRYSKDVAEEKREAEEREVEEKLKAVPEDDIPTVIEYEQEVQELPAEESKNDPVMEEENTPAETAAPDSTSSL